MNLALEGKVYPEVPFWVDPERVAVFREVLGISEGVPPTFATVADFAVFSTVIGDQELGLDYERVVHGEQAYEWDRPMREGETLTLSGQLESIREKAGHGFLTVRIDMLDSEGKLVVRSRATMIERAD